MHKQCMARFSYVSGKGLSCQCQNFAQILQFHTFQLPLRLEPMRLMSPASFSPARLPFFCDCLGSASCDTVEPSSCSNRRKNSCPRSVTSKDPIFLLGNSILLASRAALLFSPPPLSFARFYTNNGSDHSACFRLPTPFGDSFGGIAWGTFLRHG